MSFAFRGSRGDIENGFSENVPRTSMRVHPSRPVYCNTLLLITTDILMIYMIVAAPPMLHYFVRSIVLVLFVIHTSLRMYIICRFFQARARSHAVAASGLLGHAELRFHMPPSRGRLQELRLQLALVDRDFNELDHDTLRALGFASMTPSMTEEEINALPVHKYKVPGPTNDKDGSTGSTSSSSEAAETEQDFEGAQGSANGQDDELTCVICMDDVMRGELVRSLPCSHQYHAICIDPWLRQQRTCPICKFRIGSRRQGNSARRVR